MWDIRIDHGTVITMDRDRRTLHNATIGVQDGRIAYVGPHSDAAHDVREVIDATGKLVTPGFVNAHSHSQHILMRGGPSDNCLSTLDWLHNALDPVMSAYDSRDARIAAQLYCVEALYAGITTTIENADYAARDDIYNEGVRAYDESGLRFLYGDVFADRPPEQWSDGFEVLASRKPDVSHSKYPFPLQSTDRAIGRLREHMKRNRANPASRVTVCPAPMFPAVNTHEGLRKAHELAEEFDTPLLIHAAITADDRRYQMTDVQYLGSIGLLSERMVAAHMIDVDTRDIALLRTHDVKIAYCPVSNAWGAHGIAPIREYLNAGLSVGIGTDDPNANQSVNILHDVRVGALMQSLRYGHSTVSASEALEMATIGGAECAGLADTVGSIEEGKHADLLVIDARGPNMIPMHSPESALVYQAVGSEIETVLVEGEILLRDRTPQRMSNDEVATLLDDAQSASLAALRRCGMSPAQHEEEAG